MSFIPVNTPSLRGNEKQYLCDCIDSGWISSEGPFVTQLEEIACGVFQTSHAIAVSSGTAALDIAIDSLGLSVGDEVILPSFTIISCIHQIIRSGLKPVLIDSDPVTWNINHTLIAEKITSRTRAIMVVHTYGLPVDLDPILHLCNKHGLYLIEDTAELIGHTYKGKPCGSFGDISILSFYPNKHVTTGEGGMILTSNASLANTCRSLRNLCFDNTARFVHRRLGWNYRLSNLHAAVGVAQFELLQETLAIKRKIGMTYSSSLKQINKLQIPLDCTQYASNIYWVFGILIDPTLGSASDFILKYRELGIGTRPFFCPMHRQPVLKSLGLFPSEEYPVADYLYAQGLYLPSGVGLTEDQLSHVIEITLNLFS
ncbi:perosamine synthetase protein family [Synechococcus sp. Minos11]|uniref:DegT/DnrJ/EryC1/StrS family aminotransferase n=1 Tax=Synechococcus sp. Minos11 TaxID=221341 RepID=UPI001647C7BA|nr:DegT/DnrJ/EryC1/StrS aminotransferase family protein [Synechococcus sp. Minos11]QNJ07698.1 perosamine synthetase protein family [Synechococcus sp. Minos11]